ncbi:sulfurtransferase [Priestia aryabhattai]|uniref:sulfurtransferase n=1 Tax=Priestia aryabhattai TaxID=412384 RepID=UPI001C0D73E2|nr:sulfurtransferase [Priestia aryabhattai]MBU3573574.1 sulfurtransferase [Priestia aryabhattai]WDL86543.1 sulfurtransferase [Priestia aryabhattai]
MLYITVLLLATLFIAYRRYYPVKRIQCMCASEAKERGRTVIDIRHYHEVHDSNRLVILIPYAYLKRFYSEIPQGSVHLIAGDRVELNLGVRFLRKKGFEVSSYELAACKRKGKKGVFDYGV